MSLKELTWEHHKNAERQKFVKVMFSGSIEPRLYAEFLFNQFNAYDVLEAMAMSHGLFNDMPDIRRAPKIFEDFKELWQDETLPEIKQSTQSYIAYLKTIMQDPAALMAHVYVRHMGDLSGGQMIRKKVPGLGKMFDFQDRDQAKEIIRSKINDTMADEAKRCFEFATALFKEMIND
jgi:heme oxygenase